jgi:hypothetical protein
VQTHVPHKHRETLWRELIDTALPLLRAGREADARRAMETLIQKAESSRQ